MRLAIPHRAPGAALLLAFLLAGCGEELVTARGNLPPDTALLVAPPEGSSTSYRVRMTWYGEDPEGEIAGFETEWDLSGEWTATAELGGEFTLTADPAPGGRVPTPGFHTFRVRAVDAQGLVDPTPAARSFTATSVAPTTRIVSGPGDGAIAPTTVRYSLEGSDDDGTVVAYRWYLLTKDEYFWDTGNVFTTGGAAAWADTLTYHPRPDGTYDTSRPFWTATPDPLIELRDLPELDSQGGRQLYLFGARAVDDAGVTETRTVVPDNTRRLSVSTQIAGPRLTVYSPELGHAWSSVQRDAAVVFAGQPFRFRWDATPGPSGYPALDFSWAWRDSSTWSPWSQDREYPPDGLAIAPAPGPYQLFVRARDEIGLLSTIAASVDVYPGPATCEPQDQTIVVILDTDPTWLAASSILPPSYRGIERSLVDFWFQDYDFQVVETLGGSVALDPALLSCASTVVWIHSSSVAGGDRSTLLDFHSLGTNFLASYQAAGGNLLLCGIQPSQAVRFVPRGGPLYLVPALMPSYPLDFVDPGIPEGLPHWIVGGMGVASIELTVGAAAPPALRLHIATSQASGYPDLPFDSLTWPNGPIVRGFGLYDLGVTPTATAQALYTLNATGEPVAVRRLTCPGPGGNAIYLGLHPYFVERPAFRQFLVAAMTDFGEVRKP